MNYQIIRSRRRTAAIQISRAGEVTVRCPMRMPLDEIERLVQRKQGWITGHLTKLQNAPTQLQLSEEALRSLKKKAKTLIAQRVADLAPMVGVSYERVAIRAQHSRWGSCSSKGNLNFNCLLALVPDYVLDYIVIHELCHRKHPNHSSRFWAEVARVMPDYKSAEKWLKENGGRLIASLPK